METKKDWLSEAFTEIGKKWMVFLGLIFDPWNLLLILAVIAPICNIHYY